MKSTSFRSRLKEYFSPESYLGVHIALGLVLMLICGGAFLYLAEDVANNDPIVQFDKAVVFAIHANVSPTLVEVMRTISLAGEQIPTIVTILLVIYFIWRRQWNNLLMFVLVIVGGLIVDALFKVLFHRLRPAFVDPVATGIGYSFPSGHAMGAMVFYGLLAYLLMRDNKMATSRVLIVVIFLLIVGLIGFSRIYLGVHYPSDVLGGYIAGFTWLLLSISGVEAFSYWHQTGRAPVKVL